MKFDLQIVDPLTYRDWDRLLGESRIYSFSYSSNWARVLHDSYGYKPLYFAIMDRDRILGMVLVMEVDSPITGRRGVSLPFTDYCTPFVAEGIDILSFVELIYEYGKKARWKYVELSGIDGYPDDFTPSHHYFNHVLHLFNNEESIFSNFRTSTQRNVKKAINNGIEITVSRSLNSVQHFCRLNIMTRKRHGLPPQPYYFFKNVYKHIISKNKGFVILAHYENRCIAGAVFLNNVKKGFFKYGASDEKFHHLRPNNLVMWTAIKWYIKNDFDSLCFGRTEPENKGLMQFKRGWGTEEKLIKYYKFDLRTGAYVQDSSKVLGWYNGIFRKMPLSLLNLSGSLLYKHVG